VPSHRLRYDRFEPIRTISLMTAIGRKAARERLDHVLLQDYRPVLIFVLYGAPSLSMKYRAAQFWS
jgi:hypothetical protein